MQLHYLKPCRSEPCDFTLNEFEGILERKRCSSPNRGRSEIHEPPDTVGPCSGSASVPGEHPLLLHLELDTLATLRAGLILGAVVFAGEATKAKTTSVPVSQPMEEPEQPPTAQSPYTQGYRRN